MSTHRYIDRICVVIAVLSLLLTVGFLNGEALGLSPAGKTLGYESRLFDPARVHTIDLVMDDWDGFLATCQSEEYSVCSAVIDGESYKNIGIRGKGNTSLSSVAAMGSSRYSFKIEFDQYDSTKSYHGLDKLSLNNLIQDNTMMKDYLVYRMMNAFGAAGPLCSYVYLTVNGEDWGLYLAVEGVEDAFLQRNYGSDSGALYKPDSMSFGGGRGNGRDFDMNDFAASSEAEGKGSFAQPGQPGQMPDFGAFSPPSPPGDGTPEAAGETPPGGPDMPRQQTELPPDGMDRGAPDPSALLDGEGFGSRFGGASDVKLQYIDDDPDSYANIFDNAKTDVSPADQTRLIDSLRSLSNGEDLENVLDMDAVLRYFVVHNFVVNGDSYTGSMIHNYYLYEKDGRLSMIPWDYNLAFGTFAGGAASASVNDAIDNALSDRPMQAWIFSDERYTQRYHALYAEFLDTVDAAQLIGDAYALIADYVEKDPTKFCTCEAFEAGVQALKEFCALRSQSVRGQLAGTIPATSEGQTADPSALVSADGLDLSDLGTMNSGGPGGAAGPGDAARRNGGAQDAAAPGPRPGRTDPAAGSAGQSGASANEPPKGTTPFGTAADAPQADGGAARFAAKEAADSSDPSGSGATDTEESAGPAAPFDGGSFPLPGGGAGGMAPPGAQTAPAAQPSALLLLGVSALVLALGLWAAARYRR